MKDNELGKVNEFCSFCRYKNIINISLYIEFFIGFWSYMRYSIKVRVINIVVRDKIEVIIFYGEYSNLDYVKISDVGE